MSYDQNQLLTHLPAFFAGPYLAFEGQSRRKFEDGDDCCHFPC